MMHRWQRIESLCHAALARPAGERAAFLAEACGEDAELRAEVESLLTGADSAPSFLETPIVGVSPPSLVGRQLGAYRLDAPIGAGGMGEVYRATDTRLGRDVAVKILPAAVASDPQRRTRFEREARAVAALNHPNICTIHDVGHDQGVDFLVMELVEGESLAARLARGPLPLDEALGRAIEIADALDRAHRQGIIHRDLKPGNVMLAKAGSGEGTQAKLLDFGLARIMPSGASDAALPTADTPKTETGAVLGTLQYMAPEQIEGRPADARTDIFAFGALLYEMLTGRRAFEGPSTPSLMAAILREHAPSVRQRELDRIIRRCLAKDPLRRYQSARDLFNDLEEVRDAAGSTPRQETTGAPDDRLAGGRRRGGPVARPALALAAAAAIAASGFFAGLWSRPFPANPSGRFQLQPPPRLTVLPSSPSSPALAVSPDGQWVAFRAVADGTNEIALYLRSIHQLEVRRIAVQGNLPFFSPDGRWLGFFAGRALFKLALGGERPQPERICEVAAEAVRGASWGDDGTIVFSLDRRLWRVPSVGGEPAELTRPDSGARATSSIRHYWPHVLPGSAAAVFTVNDGYNDRWRRIAVVSLKTGEIRTFPELLGTAPRYVPGHLVFSRFGALHAVRFDIARLEVVGEAVEVLGAVQTFAGSGSVGFDVASSGALVYIPEANLLPLGDLVWIDRRSQIVPLLTERRPYVGAALGPRGGILALSIADDFGEADVSLYDIDRGAWTRLTVGMHAGSQLAWSPDGAWIAFTSFKSGEAELYRVPSRAGGSVEQLTSDVAVWEHPASVSPDGNVLFFTATRPSRTVLMSLRLEPRGTPEPVRPASEFLDFSPRISPDGRWLAYESNETGNTDVHVSPYPGPGAAVRVSRNGGNNPMWSPNGRELFYQRGAAIWTVMVEPGSVFAHGVPQLFFEPDFVERSARSYVPAGVSDRLAAIRRDRPHLQIVYVPNWLEELKSSVDR